MAQNNYNWPINPTTVTSGPIQIEINGLPTTVGIDTTTPANSVPLPVQEFSRIVQFNYFKASTSNISNTPVALATVSQYSQGIEIVNTTGGSLILQINAVDKVIIGPDGMKRQAMALVATDVLTVKAAESTTLDGGVV